MAIGYEGKHRLSRLEIDRLWKSFDLPLYRGAGSCMYIKKGRGDFVPDIGVDLDHVEERMLGILSAVSGFEAGDITDEWHLIRDLDLDSLDLAVIAVGCEQEFGIEYDERRLWRSRRSGICCSSCMSRSRGWIGKRL